LEKAFLLKKISSFFAEGFSLPLLAGAFIPAHVFCQPRSASRFAFFSPD